MIKKAFLWTLLLCLCVPAYPGVSAPAPASDFQALQEAIFAPAPDALPEIDFGAPEAQWVYTCDNPFGPCHSWVCQCTAQCGACGMAVVDCDYPRICECNVC